MGELVDANSGNIVSVDGLNRALAQIETGRDALEVMDYAARLKDAFKIVGRSVEECNQVASVYLRAYRKFGELVADVPSHRPEEKERTDTHLPGTRNQRRNARKFNSIATDEDIEDYVPRATESREQASIKGCMEWLQPSGRHTNLVDDYEWYTPKSIVDAARKVMGGIDLDPASCEYANQHVQATEIFTENQNGLEQYWQGRIFVNPPFAHPTVKHFADKLIESFGDGSVTQAVWLSNACVDVAWWHALASMGTVCFHRGRIKFYNDTEKLQPPTLGQSIIYLGPRQAEFEKEFIEFGVVLS